MSIRSYFIVISAVVILSTQVVQAGEKPGDATKPPMMRDLISAGWKIISHSAFQNWVVRDMRDVTDDQGNKNIHKYPGFYPYYVPERVVKSYLLEKSGKYVECDDISRTESCSYLNP